MAGQAPDDRSTCSFCGKRRDQVEQLVEGPGVRICDKCVDLVNEILEEELPAWPWAKAADHERRPNGDAADIMKRLRTRYGRPRTIPPGIDDELDRIWVEFRKDPTGPALPRLVDRYRFLTPDVADLPRIQAAVERGGRQGLEAALRSYRSWQGESFESFARPVISGMVLFELQQALFDDLFEERM